MTRRSAQSAISRPIQFDDALITSFVRYHESDCVVRLFTRRYGRLTAFFKRGLALKKGQGMIQSPAMARVGLIFSPNGLARMTELDFFPTNEKLALSVRAFAYASYISEVIEKMLPEEDQSEEIFTMVTDAFLRLCDDGATPVLLRSFELKMLDHGGYLPEMPESLNETAVLSFDPVSCRFFNAPVEGSYPFSPEALKLAKSMLIAKVGAINYEGRAELVMIGRIFQSRLKLMGLIPLKSAIFLKKLRPAHLDKVGIPFDT